MPEVTSGADKTIELHLTWVKWKNYMVAVQSERECAHKLEIMHHYGEDGKHYCPTGFLLCPWCGGTAVEPKPYECTKWKEK